MKWYGAGKFKDYWYATGKPTFLVNMLKERPVDISEVEVAESDLGTYEPSNPSLVPLLYQTGYLTIKRFDQVGESAQLKPRNGVRHRLAEKRRLTIGDGQENASCAGRLTTTLLPILKRVDADSHELGKHALTHAKLLPKGLNIFLRLNALVARNRPSNVCSVMYLPVENGLENRNITENRHSLGNSSYSQNSPFLSTFSTPASPRSFVSIMTEQAISPTP